MARSSSACLFLALPFSTAAAGDPPHPSAPPAGAGHAESSNGAAHGQTRRRSLGSTGQTAARRARAPAARPGGRIFQDVLQPTRDRGGSPLVRYGTVIDIARLIRTACSAGWHKEFIKIIPVFIKIR